MTYQSRLRQSINDGAYACVMHHGSVVCDAKAACFLATKRHVLARRRRLASLGDKFLVITGVTP